MSSTVIRFGVSLKFLYFTDIVPGYHSSEIFNKIICSNHPSWSKTLIFSLWESKVFVCDLFNNVTVTVCRSLCLPELRSPVAAMWKKLGMQVAFKSHMNFYTYVTARP